MDTETELIALRSDTSHCSLAARAGLVVDDFFREQRSSYGGVSFDSHSPSIASCPSTSSRANQLRLYGDEDRCLAAAAESRRFLEAHPEWLAGPEALSNVQLRRLVALQHFTAVDVEDLALPSAERRMDDSFTDAGVSQQLVLDAGRSDFVLPGGLELSFRRELESRGVSLEQNSLEVEHLLRDFEDRLVCALLSCLGDEAPRILVQAISRSMSQSGMANLERALRGGPQLVVSGGEQSLRYELSKISAHVWEVHASLKKFDFEQFVAVSEAAEDDEDDDHSGKVQVLECDPRSQILRGCVVRFDATSAAVAARSSADGGVGDDHHEDEPLSSGGLLVDVRGLVDRTELFDRFSRPLRLEAFVGGARSPRSPASSSGGDRRWSAKVMRRAVDLARSFGLSRSGASASSAVFQAIGRCQRCRRRRQRGGSISGGLVGGGGGGGLGGSGGVGGGLGAIEEGGGGGGGMRRSAWAALSRVPTLVFGGGYQDAEHSMRAPLREPPV